MTVTLTSFHSFIFLNLRVIQDTIALLQYCGTNITLEREAQRKWSYATILFREENALMEDHSPNLGDAHKKVNMKGAESGSTCPSIRASYRKGGNGYHEGGTRESGRD